MEDAHAQEVVDLTAAVEAGKAPLVEEVAELNDMLDQMTKKNIELDEQMKGIKDRQVTALRNAQFTLLCPICPLWHQT